MDSKNRTEEQNSKLRELPKLPFDHNSANVAMILADNSFFSTGTNDAAKDWVNARLFLVKSIIGNGTFLDVGCGNGLLLKCLEMWSSFSITPYGIDRDSELIEKAKVFFPEQKENFFCLPIQDIGQLKETALLTAYDYVYWNVWDNWMLEEPTEQKCLHEIKLLVSPGGCLILGFYDKFAELIQDKVERATQVLGVAGNCIDNETGKEVAAVFRF